MGDASALGYVTLLRPIKAHRVKIETCKMCSIKIKFREQPRSDVGLHFKCLFLKSYISYSTTIVTYKA